MTRPRPPLRNPLTSSRKTIAGSTSRIIRRTSGQIQRLSLVFLRLPATLHGWHGMPAWRISIALRHGLPSKVATSDQTASAGTEPSSARDARIAAGWASLSTATTVRYPGRAILSPRPMPSHPAQTDIPNTAGLSTQFTHTLPLVNLRPLVNLCRSVRPARRWFWAGLSPGPDTHTAA